MFMAARPLSLLLLPLLLVALYSCGSAVKLKHSEEIFASSPVGWDQVTTDKPVLFQPSADYPVEAEVDPEAIAIMASRLGGDHALAEIAIRQAIRNPVLLDRGVYGKVGTDTYFATTTDRIPNFDRLYWAMVKVLSEKYGCFMKNKSTSGNSIRFGCRDGRHVVMWRARNDRYMQFYGRQFDRDFRELHVEKHKIIARGSKPKSKGIVE